MSKYVLLNEKEMDLIRALADDNEYRIARLEAQNIPQDGTLYSLDALNKLLEKLNHA